MRLTLDGTGGVVDKVAPMVTALPQFDDPGPSTIWGGSLFYIANTGADESAGAVVMSTNLDAVFEVEPPTIEELQKAIKAQPQ
jgi:hypothetical protein